MITNSIISNLQATQVFLASGEQAITTVFFCNQSDTVDCLVDVYLVPVGQTPGMESLVMKKLPLVANETFVFDTEKLVLSAGDSIYAQTSQPNTAVATVSSMAM